MVPTFFACFLACRRISSLCSRTRRHIIHSWQKLHMRWQELPSLSPSSAAFSFYLLSFFLLFLSLCFFLHSIFLHLDGLLGHGAGPALAVGGGGRKWWLQWRWWSRCD
ncbi:hypothetical protein L873DRAFT_1473715 [Choiromyces venosus 120613-1]|uniref:Uncharacterized protein n=1 Tax=Choiromyces venosus 120613-1 TaxID=1336337 RepID=A0A3N4JJU3_9PEZI|nr:hypothetical protein L873DRAFT_1473715 [Choiromyces venosus 120613-1]